MATCYNCRKAVSWSADRCPHCGIVFQPGTWKTQTDLVEPRSEGWGLAPTTLRSFGFRVGAVLCPVWFSLFVGLVAGPQPGGPMGLMLLIGLFVFIPGI